MSARKNYEADGDWQSWSVRLTRPKNGAEGRRWASNQCFGIVAKTIEDAIQIAKTKYPDCTVWGCTHRGNDAWLFDAEFRGRE